MEIGIQGKLSMKCLLGMAVNKTLLSAFKGMSREGI